MAEARQDHPVVNRRRMLNRLICAARPCDWTQPMSEPGLAARLALDWEVYDVGQARRRRHGRCGQPPREERFAGT